MKELEDQLILRNQKLLDGIAQLAGVFQETSRKHQDGLIKVTEVLTRQAVQFAQLQEGEAHLLRLQESLNQNLSSLAGAGAFDEAVQSLTAAIHLLTTRMATPAPTLPKLAPRPAA